MSKSIRISAELATQAERAAALAHRSPPQQIEHWAQIGRVLEPALSYSVEARVKQVGRAELDARLIQIGTKASVRRTQTIVRRHSGRFESID